MDTDSTPGEAERELEREIPAPAAGTALPIEVITRGEGAEEARRRLERALQHVAARSPRRPMFIRASLTFEPHHLFDERAEAKAALDVGGHVVHAQAKAATFAESIDQLVDRLRHSLHELAERQSASRRRRPAEGRGGS